MDLAELIALAVAVALSPIPIGAVVVILASLRARPNGLAFLAGWVAGMVGICVVVLLVADREPGEGADGLADALRLALGVVLVLFAAQQWQSRPRAGARAGEPRWLRTVDELTAWRAAGLGLLLSAVYPKTLLLVATAAAAIAETSSNSAAQAVALIGFVLIGASGIGTPVAIQLALGRRSERTLAKMRMRIVRNGGVLLPLLFLLVGAALIAQSAPDILGGG